MYIAICDDQVNELEHIIKLLNMWQEAHGVTLRYMTFRNAGELLAAAEKEHFTLYLLDVMMPGTNGITAAREIRSFDEVADIVFLTSSADFAYASYGVHALDYFLKPIQPENLFPVLDRLAMRENEPQDGLLLKYGATLIHVPFSQIIYVEVVNKHLFYHLTDGTVKKFSGTLNQCEPLLLSRPEFKRIYRSYIVNLQKVTEISPTTAKIVSGEELPVSRGLYHELQKDYMDLLFARKDEV